MRSSLRRLRTWLALGSLGAALWVSACSSKKDADEEGTGGRETGGAQSLGGNADQGGAAANGGVTGKGGSATNGGALSEAGTGGDSAQAGAGGVLGVGGAPDLGDGSGLPNAPAGSWTYLVYMLADNNLEPFGLDDMKELMAVGSGSNVTILAEIDRAVGESSAAIGGLPNFTTTKRVRVDAGKLTELEDLGEQNLGSAQTFQEFLEWGLTFSPSEHYAVILWDHGGAWPRYGADDSAQGDGLTLPELTRGIDGAAKSTGLLGPLDVLGFDACLMGTWEVAASFAGRAHYLLASEEVEPGHGWDHRAVSVLKTEPTALALGEAMITGYQAQAVANQDTARITLALTDLDKVPELSRALTALSGAMQTPIDTHAPLVGRARAGISTFGEIPGGPSTGMVDLLEFVNTLEGLDATLQTPIAAVRDALGSAVVNKVAGPALADVGGLSLFFPSVASGYDPDYAALGVATTWRSFLSSYYDAASSLTQSPEFTNPNKEALVTEVLGTLHVAGQLRAGTFDNLASTTFDFGIVGADDTVYVLGDEPADVDRNGLVTKDWNESALQVVQGVTTDYAYYVLEAMDNGLVSLSVPLGYDDQASQEFVLLQLVFQSDATLVSSSYYVETNGAWAELVPAAGATYRTLVPTIVNGAADVSWEPQSEVFDASTALDLQFANLPAGTNVFVELTATDFAERGDYVINSGAL